MEYKAGQIISFEDDYFKILCENRDYQMTSSDKIVEVLYVYKNVEHTTMLQVNLNNGWMFKLPEKHFRAATEIEIKKYKVKKIFIK